MPNFEIMEPGSPLRTKEKNIPAKQGQSILSEGQPPDFLMNVLLKLLEPAKQVPGKSQGEPVELKRPGKESLDLTSAESATPVDLPENKDNEDLSIFPPLESFFAGKGQMLKEFLNNETPANVEDPGEGNPGLGKPNQERPVEGRSLKESLNLKEGEGLNSRLDDTLLLNTWKIIAEKITQSRPTGTSRIISVPEEGKFGKKNPNEQTSAQDAVQGEELADVIFKVQTTQNRPSPPSMILQKMAGEPSENGKEKQPGLPLVIKEVYWGGPRGPLADRDREGSEITFDFERLNKNEISPNGDILPVKGSSQAQIPPIDLKDQSFWNSIGTEKTMIDKHNPLDLFSKSFEAVFSKDHSFTVKHQTPSSMEISLEPAGLGRLDIELNLSQDRLQGQIMVNDNAGKELIERNLPQLLSELAREGLQIGEFTVSLRNQGRGQTPVPIRTEFKEPSLVTVDPEWIVPIQGTHLIHIII